MGMFFFTPSCCCGTLGPCYINGDNFSRIGMVTGIDIGNSFSGAPFEYNFIGADASSWNMRSGVLYGSGGADSYLQPVVSHPRGVPNIMIGISGYIPTTGDRLIFGFDYNGSLSDYYYVEFAFDAFPISKMYGYKSYPGKKTLKISMHKVVGGTDTEIESSPLLLWPTGGWISPGDMGGNGIYYKKTEFCSWFLAGLTNVHTVAQNNTYGYLAYERCTGANSPYCYLEGNWKLFAGTSADLNTVYINTPEYPAPYYYPVEHKGIGVEYYTNSNTTHAYPVNTNGIQEVIRGGNLKTVSYPVGQLKVENNNVFDALDVTIMPMSGSAPNTGIFFGINSNNPVAFSGGVYIFRTMCMADVSDGIINVGPTGRYTSEATASKQGMNPMCPVLIDSCVPFSYDKSTGSPEATHPYNGSLIFQAPGHVGTLGHSVKIIDGDWLENITLEYIASGNGTLETYFVNDSPVLQGSIGASFRGGSNTPGETFKFAIDYGYGGARYFSVEMEIACVGYYNSIYYTPRFEFTTNILENGAVIKTETTSRIFANTNGYYTYSTVAPFSVFLGLCFGNDVISATYKQYGFRDGGTDYPTYGYGNIDPYAAYISIDIDTSEYEFSMDRKIRYRVETSSGSGCSVSLSDSQHEKHQGTDYFTPLPDIYGQPVTKYYNIGTNIHISGVYPDYYGGYNIPPYYPFYSYKNYPTGYFGPVSSTRCPPCVGQHFCGNLPETIIVTIPDNFSLLPCGDNGTVGSGQYWQYYQGEDANLYTWEERKAKGSWVNCVEEVEDGVMHSSWAEIGGEYEIPLENIYNHNYGIYKLITAANSCRYLPSGDRGVYTCGEIWASDPSGLIIEVWANSTSSYGYYYNNTSYGTPNMSVRITVYGYTKGCNCRPSLYRGVSWDPPAPTGGGNVNGVPFIKANYSPPRCGCCGANSESESTGGTYGDGCAGDSSATDYLGCTCCRKEIRSWGLAKYSYSGDDTGIGFTNLTAINDCSSFFPVRLKLINYNGNYPDLGGYGICSGAGKLDIYGGSTLSGCQPDLMLSLP